MKRFVFYYIKPKHMIPVSLKEEKDDFLGQRCYCMPIYAKTIEEAEQIVLRIMKDSHKNKQLDISFENQYKKNIECVVKQPYDF